MALTALFQSHAGSIEAKRPLLWFSGAQCFNPTLVRLRLIRCLRCQTWIDEVSIPRWFD